MGTAVMFAVAATVLLCVVVELVAAVLPLALVIALVKPEDRRALADVLAAIDSSRRLRLWPDLRRAVSDRRRRLGCRSSPDNMP